MHPLSLVVLFAFAVATVETLAKTQSSLPLGIQRNSLLRGGMNDNNIVLECRLHWVVVTCQPGVADADCPDVVECTPRMDQDDDSWSVHSYRFQGDVSSNTFLPHMYMILQGYMHATISGGYVDPLRHMVVVPKGAKIHLQQQATVLPEPPHPHHRRKLSTNAVGIHHVVVLRISTPDSQPTISASDLYDRIFATTTTNPTLATQYAACSAGALQMQQRISGGTGVVDVLLSHNVEYYNETSTMVVEATNLMIAQFHLQATTAALTAFADHVMFVLPPNPYISLLWIGNAVVGGWRLACNDIYCGYLSVFMHEVGHNLGLLHSNQNGITYNDRTGYMGSGVADDFYPRECFNAANHWNLNWYTNRRLHVDPSNGPVKFQLAAFVNYNQTTTNEPTVVQVGNTHYMQYNWAADYNSDTSKYPNMVVYVHDLFNSTELLAALAYDGINEEFVESNFEATGNALVLQVCGASTGGGGGGSTNAPVTITIGVGYNADEPCAQGQWVGVTGPILATQPSPSPPTPSPIPISTTTTCVDLQTRTFPVSSSSSSGSVIHQEHCTWLQRRLRRKHVYCANNHTAMWICLHTCGTCDLIQNFNGGSSKASSSSCADNATATFIIAGKTRNCEFVLKHLRQWNHLCTKRADIRTCCAETCGQCATSTSTTLLTVVETANVMISPSTANTTVAVAEPDNAITRAFIAPATPCQDDDQATFRVALSGRLRNCLWLAKRPFLVETYCGTYPNVRIACPMTCHFC